MLIKERLLSALVLCVFLGFLSTAIAAESANSKKKHLFEKFMQVTGAQKQHMQMIEIITEQLKMKFDANLQQLSRKLENATPEQQDRFARISEGAADRVSTRIEESFSEEMPFPELIDKVYYPLYDKHFDESELRKIIDFYETPAGQKIATVMPSLMHETVSIFKRLYGQKMQDLSRSIMKDELQRILAEMQKSE
jgi:hypothetical protein